jgi:16S rRNA (uracil1498-N3)-methyltransferase
MRRLVVPAGWLDGDDAGERALPDEHAHYVREVLRLPLGSELELLDGAGRRARARLRRGTKRELFVELEAVRVESPPPGPHLTLLQAVGKGDKLDTVVRQATELGARRIVPVLSERAVARHEQRLERWNAIAEDALRVSARTVRPTIEAPTPLDDLLARPRAELALCFALEDGRPLSEVLAERSPSGLASIELLIGPEGGLTPAEVSAARAAGFLTVHLGQHTLRTETAGPAAAAILLFWAGAL